MDHLRGNWLENFNGYGTLEYPNGTTLKVTFPRIVRWKGTKNKNGYLIVGIGRMVKSLELQL